MRFPFRFIYIAIVYSLINLLGGGPSALAEQETKEPMQFQWQFEGITGTFDRQSIQRGFQVYKEICSACHSLKRIAFRNLEAVGFTKKEIDQLASEYMVWGGIDDEGSEYEKPGVAANHFPPPYPNDQAARAANGGALPVDLSLIIKARHDGPNYLYSLLTGYKDVPKDFVLDDGMYYNPYFPGKKLAMPPPLVDAGMVQYIDGTESTIDQMAWDVVNFLQWAAEPEMEERKGMGVAVFIFLSILTILLYFSMKNIARRFF